MLSGDVGRSIFAGAVCTLIFAVVIPMLISLIGDWLGFSHPQGFCFLVAYCGVCFITVLSQSIIPRFRLNPHDKSVLITGCDTGFGLLLAKRLDEIGMHVFAGCLLKDKKGEGAQELARTGSNRLHVIQLDVTNEQQVADALRYIQLHLPKSQKGLWGIVNNAGASAFGDIEWSSIDLYKKIAEVNLWGVIRCTKVFLPSIRRTQGRVVNMASGLGRMMAPSRSVYAITKWGVEGFSDCLRYEMSRWGVKVSIIEPGNFIAGTNIFTNKSVKELSNYLWNGTPDQVKQDYGKEAFEKGVRTMEQYCNYGMTDLTPVIKAYEDALLSRWPFTRYQPMTAYWAIRSFIFTHFPALVADRIFINTKP